MASISTVDLSRLSLEQQVAQTVVVRASGCLFDRQIVYPDWEPPAAKLDRWLHDLGVGGVILHGGSAGEIYLRSRQLQARASVPLLVAADIEEGVGQRFTGATPFPPPMALGAIAAENLALACEYARQMGSATASEAVAIGLNWLFAPVVDVNNNPDNPVINIRAFGETPDIVSQLTAAFIRGTQSSPVLATAKHFPGHGDTAVDSHLELPVLPFRSDRLDAVELPPFRAAIAAGVDSIMSAHLSIPAWDDARPATLSRRILTEQLRDRLGFSGLIVTDALIMGGIAKYTSPEEAPVLAFEAGADVLLMPDDPEAAIAGVVAAVKSGRIERDRLLASVQRIEQAKQKVAREPVAEEAFIAELARPEAEKVAAAIARDSLQCGGRLPLPVPEGEKCNLLVADDLTYAIPFARHLPAVAYPRQLGYRPYPIEQARLPEAQIAAPTLLQLFLRGNPFRGTAGLSPEAKDALQNLLASGWLHGAIVCGSPYLLDWLRSQFPPEFPWVFSPAQIPVAQAIALETLFGSGTVGQGDRGDFL